ncbi:hypothetical protein EVAR_84443_1 [Eumeta japonica]|uniref:Uncharacterized protein n=1 Tax=Eumeta variegata TaxID=151549 RepID=A0A4C1W321_EUMVA|nr:hypothetical protein EVAR_84443_1 [Eumeta japonica]
MGERATHYEMQQRELLLPVLCENMLSHRPSRFLCCSQVGYNMYIPHTMVQWLLNFLDCSSWTNCNRRWPAILTRSSVHQEGVCPSCNDQSVVPTRGLFFPSDYSVFDFDSGPIFDADLYNSR